MSESLLTGLKSEWSRRAAYDFTACLAHVEVTFSEGKNEINRIAGYPYHNVTFEATTMSCFPQIPLHPHVVEVALNQLKQE